MLSRSRPRRIALWLGVAAALLAGSAHAADTGNGSKNFRTPASVPNYFSNEAGPMLGPAYETQRGPLYMSQTYGAPPAPARADAEALPRLRQHVAMAVPRGRALRGRHGERVVASHIAVHGRAVAHVTAHHNSRGHSGHVAAARSAGRAHVIAAHSTTKARVGNVRHPARG